MGILWIVIIGFVAGIIARLLAPGPNNPSGFILTTLLGHRRRVPRDLDRSGDRLYGPDQGAGLIASVVGAHRRAVHLAPAGAPRASSPDPWQKISAAAG